MEMHMEFYLGEVQKRLKILVVWEGRNSVDFSDPENIKANYKAYELLQKDHNEELQKDHNEEKWLLSVDSFLSHYATTQTVIFSSLLENSKNKIMKVVSDYAEELSGRFYRAAIKPEKSTKVLDVEIHRFIENNKHKLVLEVPDLWYPL
mgnify:CR=1 FL=1